MGVSRTCGLSLPGEGEEYTLFSVKGKESWSPKTNYIGRIKIDKTGINSY